MSEAAYLISDFDTWRTSCGRETLNGLIEEATYLRSFRYSTCRPTTRGA